MAKMPDIKVNVEVTVNGVPANCTNPIGLVFSTGPDIDNRDPVIFVSEEKCAEHNSSDKGVLSMEKVMLVNQVTTARVVSFKASDGKIVPLPTNYEVFWVTAPGIVSIDATSSGECVITSLGIAGETAINATVKYTDKNGVVQAVTDTISIKVQDRPAPEPALVGLNFEIDNPIDIQAPNNPPSILIRSVSVNR